MSEIKRLSQQVINQIAAGEVVERPASVVKELLENSIDAGATKIELSLTDGGLTRIEVKDNGKGIAREDLRNALERYATSKLTTAEELETIGTYGFRGEALAAISAVSKTTLLSSKDSEAFSISSDNGVVQQEVPGVRAKGTTITIENLFSTIPARQKFLKSSETEYKYILRIFTAFALLNGKIHFELKHNERSVYVLPETKSDAFPPERVAKLFSINPDDLLLLNHNEYGIRITGYLLHPRALSLTSKFLSVFVNRRPVEDKGVIKSLNQGIVGFAPPQYKASCILHVELSPEQVDVNVHPRKTEIKLLNPFRVYAAITHAVKASLQQQVAAPDRAVANDKLTSSSFSYTSDAAGKGTQTWENRQENAYSRLRGTQAQFLYDDSNHYESAKPIDSYADVSFGSANESGNEYKDRIPEYHISKARLSISGADITPILGRYIVVGFEDEVWIVDQHAAAERVRYEQLQESYLEGKALVQQQLLTPLSIHLTEEEAITIRKHHEVFGRLGYTTTSDGNTLLVSAIPSMFTHADTERLVRDVIGEMIIHDDIFLTPVIEDFSSTHSISLIIATMACHNSVRMNERISTVEARSIVQNLLQCKIPYACPHGRRVVWRLSKEEVDREFMRT